MIRPSTFFAVSLVLAGCGSSDGSLFGGGPANQGGSDAGASGGAPQGSGGGAGSSGASSGGRTGSGGGSTTGGSGNSTGGTGTGGNDAGGAGGALLDAGGDAESPGSGGANASGGAGGAATGGQSAGGVGGQLGAGGKATGGAVSDSGVPVGVATPKSISCGTTSCTISSGLTNVCCALPLSFPPFPTGCFPSFPGCVTTGVPFACDDAADCQSGGDICCGSTGGTSCAKACNASKVQFCRTDDECKSGQCRPWATASEYSTCQ